nr:VP2 protein [Rotavirus J]
MESITLFTAKLDEVKPLKEKADIQQLYDEIVQKWDEIEITDLNEDDYKELLRLIKSLESVFKVKGVNVNTLRNETQQKQKQWDEKIKKENESVKEEQNADNDRNEEETQNSNSDNTPDLMDKILKYSAQGNTNPFTNDVLQIRSILSKTLFVDTDNESYSVYVPEASTYKVSPIEITFKTIDTFDPKTKITRKQTIILSNNNQVADALGPADVLYTSSFFDDMTSTSIKELDLYFLDKALGLKKELPNLNYISKLDKEVNPMNVANTVTTSFNQKEYYDMVMDRQDRSLDARRQAIEFDNVVVDAQRRTVRFPVRLHPFDNQLIDIAANYAVETQDLANAMREYAMLGADGYVITPKVRVDRDQRLIYNRRSQVLNRLCELSGLVYRTRILHSMRLMTPLWRTNVFQTSLEDEITRIYSAAEVSMVAIDATVSALSSINIGVAKQTLDALLNMSFFRCELELVGSQSSFGAALSAAIALLVLPTDQDHMDEEVFDILCNLVYNELIAWPSDLPSFVRRNGATNAFRQYVNAGVNREIAAYMRHVLLRRPWLPLVQSNDIRRQCHVLVPNIDLANVNDPTYVALNGLLNGIINASRRNPNPGRSINANSFRKLLKNLRDICVNKLMPAVRLLRYNVERVARIFQFLPYSADLFDANPNMRDERLRIKFPISGVLSLLMGITKAPDAFDWAALLNFADDIRKLDYAEAEATEDAATIAVLKNDINRSVSRKDVWNAEVKPPSPTIASVAKIPSASLSAILSDRQLINLVRNTHSFRMITEIVNALRAAFENSPTSQHGIGKGALLNPVPAPFGRSSQYVRRDNVIFQRPPNVQMFTIQQLMQGQHFAGLVAQIRARRPIFIQGPVQLRVANARDVEQVTMAYLTMNSPYDAFINPIDLRQQRMIEPREVDLFIDDELNRTEDDFDNVMAQTSVYVLDAQRLLVPIQAQLRNFDYHDIMITDSVTKHLTMTVAQPPDLQLFNGLLVFEQ